MNENNWNEYLGDEKVLKPGTLIKMNDGFIYLIGDTNENFGGCSCCQDIYQSEIAFYQQIIDLSEINNHLKTAIPIIINGKNYISQQNTINLYCICDLADIPAYPKPSVVCRVGDASKTMHNFSKVFTVEEGMIFNIQHTGNT